MMRVLVTCPPMIGAQADFLPLFEARGWQAVIPEFTQVMGEADLCDILPDCEGWIIGDDPATHRVFAAGKAGRLRAAVKWGIGVDNVDFAACEQLQIPIANTPNMFGAEVADVAVGYVIGLARHLFAIDRAVRAGNGQEGQWPKPQGQSLAGKCAGIVGFGDIGRHLCTRLSALGMAMVAWDPHVKPSDMAEVSGQVRHATWPQQLGDCDYLIFTCALNETTHHMLNAQSLAQCKANLRVINVARGALIDEVALAAALKHGAEAGMAAALDVLEIEPPAPENILLALPNVVIGSHNSSNTQEAVMRATTKAIKLLGGFLE